MKYDGILFDLDGTMWSSLGTVTQLWQRVVAKECPGLEITEELLGSCMGLRISEVGDKIFHMCTPARRKEIMDILCEKESAELTERGGKLYPELRETLTELKKTHRLFIVSNCHDGYIQAFLTAHDLWDFFEDFEYDRTGLDKGGNNRLLIERCGLKSPVYVGDTQGDANAAKKAGIPFIFAAYGFGSVAEYDAKIDCFADLLKLEL